MIFYEVTTVGEALEVYHNNSLCIVDQQRMLVRSETTILVPSTDHDYACVVEVLEILPAENIVVNQE